MDKQASLTLPTQKKKRLHSCQKEGTNLQKQEAGRFTLIREIDYWEN